MKVGSAPIVSIIAAAIALGCPARAAEEAMSADRISNTIILDESGVQNLRIETVEVEELDFETTVFAIGRIEEIPANRSVLSSRISGRAVKVTAFEGDRVEKGQVLVEVESRQPGNPPPTIPLRAAQSGLVIASHVRVGQPVEPDTEMLDVSDRSEMWAIAKIPEKEAATMELGTEARILVHAIGGEAIVAELTRFGIEADRKAGTVDGIFQISNPGEKLQPGMRAEFAIITGVRSEVMAVPRSAVQGDPAGRVVYVKDFDLPNTFVRAPVVLGEQNDEYVEVVNGLFPGDEVVTQGSYSLGFAGGGSISLKEALDAAHGHEHAEDGSELTEEKGATTEDPHAHDGHREMGGGRANTFLMVYAVLVTMFALGALQVIWSKRQASTEPSTDA
jgi:multidrug efflux pump subunit AcrA (membrane-fusion protein)